MSDDLCVVFSAQVEGEGQFARITYQAYVQRGGLAGMAVAGPYRPSIEEAAENMARLLGCGIIDASGPAAEEYTRRKTHPVEVPWEVTMTTLEKVRVMAVSQELALERAQDLPKKEWRQHQVTFNAFRESGPAD